MRLLATITVVLGEFTDIDRAVVRLVFDAGSRSFPLRTSFWLEIVMHRWAKYAVLALTCTAIAAYVLALLHHALHPARRAILFVALALAIAPLSVAAGKASSDRHCPWDIDEFGGHAPYTRLFASLPHGVDAGHCSPAGLRILHLVGQAI